MLTGHNKRYTMWLPFPRTSVRPLQVLRKPTHKAGFWGEKRKVSPPGHLCRTGSPSSHHLPGISALFSLHIFAAHGGSFIENCGRAAQASFVELAAITTCPARSNVSLLLR